MITNLNQSIDECVEYAGENLSGILHYGSSTRKESGQFSDQDLLMTAKVPDLDLLINLNGILRRTQFVVDMPVVFEAEIPSVPEDFRIINHGCYFLEVLKRGRVLHGRNIFLDIPKPAEQAVKRTLLDKITEYAQFFRRNFIESNRESTVSTNYSLNRRLVKAVHDLLWLLGIQEESDTISIELCKKHLPTLLSETEWNMIECLTNPNHTNTLSSNLTAEFSLARLAIMEKIYARALKLINP